VLGSAILVAWFAWFIRPALFNGFNNDDAMNMHQFFRSGWPEVIRKALVFFEPSYRPVGGAMYKAGYDLFGYEPLPLHLAIAAVLLGNIFLAWRFGEIASGSAAVGFLCAFASAYHARMPNLYYAPAFLYDVLCFSFYFSALNLYLAVRTRGETPSWKRLAAILGLFVLALGSKEIAVTFPVVLLLYEAACHPPASLRAPDIRAWLRGPALPSLLAGAVTAAFLAGKFRGPEAMHLTAGYAVTPTLGHIMAEQATYLNDIFYAPYDWPWFTPALAVVFWLAILGYSFFARSRCLRWACLSAIVAPLPVAVLTGRTGSSLYIPLAFYALIAAVLFRDLCAAAGSVLAPCSTRTAATAVLAACGVCAFAAMVVYQNRFTTQQMLEPTLLNKHIAAEIRRVLPKVPLRTKALYRNDLTEFWDTYFITELIWGDRTSLVWLQPKARFPQKEIDGMDYLLEFAPDRTLHMVRSPGAATRRSVP
jgi:hypothetical protein